MKTYEAYYSPDEVAAFHKVKWGSMHHGRIVREVAAEMVGGEIGDPSGGKKQFVLTFRGVFRMCGPHTDNSGEQVINARMGAKTIKYTDEDAMKKWFFSHGWSGYEGLATLEERVAARMYRA